MPTSQFTIYSSSDPNSPTLTGTSGSLIALLDACLVTGYGNKAPVGWTKPLPNDAASTGSIGCWKQASGSQFILLVTDNGFTSSAISAQASSTREAMWNGWETLVGMTGSLFNSIGVGRGNFPLDTFTTLNNGLNGAIKSASFVCRKSTDLSTTPRVWLMFADTRTMYLFTAPGDTAGIYSMCCFGDAYSLKYGNDYGKCFITGRTSHNNGVTSIVDAGDVLSAVNTNNWFVGMARSYGGGGVAINVARVGDTSRSSLSTLAATSGTGVANSGFMGGVLPTPNPVDNSLHISPIWLSETAGGFLRGRMRGVWMASHPASNFSDGQVIQGANEHAGKTFQVVKTGGSGGFWLIEISPTVETNPEIY